jgi:hypothetical protein
MRGGMNHGVGARNRITATVTNIAKGKVMCLVKVDVPARSHPRIPLGTRHQKRRHSRRDSQSRERPSAEAF